MGAKRIMGRKIIKISYVEIKQLGYDNIGLLAIQPWWLRAHGLDWQRPLYITADESSKNYIIDGWEVEDAEETKDKRISWKSER